MLGVRRFSFTRPRSVDCSNSEITKQQQQQQVSRQFAPILPNREIILGRKNEISFYLYKSPPLNQSDEAGTCDSQSEDEHRFMRANQMEERERERKRKSRVWSANSVCVAYGGSQSPPG